MWYATLWCGSSTFTCLAHQTNFLCDAKGTIYQSYWLSGWILPLHRDQLPRICITVYLLHHRHASETRFWARMHAKVLWFIFFHSEIFSLCGVMITSQWFCEISFLFFQACKHTQFIKWRPKPMRNEYARKKGGTSTVSPKVQCHVITGLPFRTIQSDLPSSDLPPVQQNITNKKNKQKEHSLCI